MNMLLTIIAWISSAVVVYRLRRYLIAPSSENLQVTSPISLKVSVIIPARNEETNIGRLLSSLQKLKTPVHEIIVVDDNSSDNTVSAAARFGVTIVRSGTRPEGWAAKNWACHVGALAASGDYFLFTDADTSHTPDSLQNALNFLSLQNADMLSAPSFHRNQLWWEKLLGPFHCLIHCGASPFDKQTRDHAYAVGQYILVKSTTYSACDGHAGVRAEVAEDAALAKHVMKCGYRYVVHAESPLFTVQMYQNFSEFCRGWVRLLRLGMRQLSFEVSFNALIPLLAMNFWNLYPPSILAYVPVVTTLTYFALVQRRLGKFSIAGILIFPISVLLFLALSCWALCKELLNAPIAWKGRVYSRRGLLRSQA